MMPWKTSELVRANDLCWHPHDLAPSHKTDQKDHANRNHSTATNSSHNHKQSKDCFSVGLVGAVVGHPHDLAAKLEK